MPRTYSIQEIHCKSCAGLIEETLDGVGGVTRIEVDVPARTLTVEYADETAESQVVARLAAEGYTARAL